MENVFSLMMGLGLSAACGFRIFVPLTIMSLLAQVGWLQLPAELSWAANPIALSGLLLATVLELGAYYIPWLDNLLDSLAIPVSMIAGTLLTFGFAPQMDPFAQWSLALIAGGGLAGTLQAATTATRAASSLSTAGLGNPLVATGEAIASIFVSILAIFAPVLALAAVAALLIALVIVVPRVYKKIKNPKNASQILAE